MPLYQIIYTVVATMVGFVTLFKTYDPTHIRSRKRIKLDIDRTQLLYNRGAIPKNSGELIDREIRQAYSIRALFARASLKSDWRSRLRPVLAIPIFAITLVVLVGFSEAVHVEIESGGSYVPPRFGPFDVFLIVAEGPGTEYYTLALTALTLLMIAHWFTFVAHSHLSYWHYCNVSYYGWSRATGIVIGYPVPSRIVSIMRKQSNPQTICRNALSETLKAFDRHPGGGHLDAFTFDGDYARRFEIEYEYILSNLFEEFNKRFEPQDIWHALWSLRYFLLYLKPARFSVKFKNELLDTETRDRRNSRRSDELDRRPTYPLDHPEE